MKSLLEATSKTVLLTKKELIAEECKLGLEAVLDNSSIPLVDYLKPLENIGMRIRERSLVRNTLYFLIGFQSGDIDEDKLKEYKKRLQDDNAFFEQETTRIIMILDNTVEVIRAKIIGCLYMNMINGRITHSEFCQYVDLTNRLYMTEIECLYSHNDKYENYVFNRLVGFGIMNNGMRFADENNDGNVIISQQHDWTRFGKKYVDIIDGVFLNSQDN